MQHCYPSRLTKSQLVDDLLDYTSSVDLGKPGEGADMQLGLATAPALFAWREFEEIGPLIKRKFKHPGDVQVVSIYSKLHINKLTPPRLKK